MLKLMTTLIALTAIGVGVKAKNDKINKDLGEVKTNINVLEQKIVGIECSLDN